jgi:hypothetical protein
MKFNGFPHLALNGCSGPGIDVKLKERKLKERKEVAIKKFVYLN